MIMCDTFAIQIIEIPPANRHEESLGSKAKFWFEDPPKSWKLFKAGRENEDWSEKVTAEFAKLLGVPCAQVELAVCKDAQGQGTRGTVSPSFLRAGDQLIHGNELLLDMDPSYPQKAHYHVRQHTLDAAMHALEAPTVLAWDSATPVVPLGFDGQDIFAGYLIFDAWIGNSDRHHENWSIVSRGVTRLLAPSYDHASSLGRNEPDEKVERRLRGKDRRATVETYASKCRSAFYETPDAAHPMTTREMAALVQKKRPGAAEHWLSKLRAIEDASVSRILDRIPAERCSALHREFARRILDENRNHLLNMSARHP
jgi:hypothetical protein